MPGRIKAMTRPAGISRRRFHCRDREHGRARCRTEFRRIPPRPRGGSQAREGAAQVRLHQAHRHGAARHRQGAWLLRGRGPVGTRSRRRPTGRSCSTASSRASSTARTCWPASRSPPPSASAPRSHVITPFSMDLNGNAITVSNEVFADDEEAHAAARTASRCIPSRPTTCCPSSRAIRAQGKPFNMGIVFPVSTHNYEMRYWLAAGGIHPGFYSKTDISGQILADVLMSVTPPPQMPATLEAGTISRLLRRRAVEPGGRVQGHRRAGRHRPRHPEATTRRRCSASPPSSPRRTPTRTLAVIKALIRAGMWLDVRQERPSSRGREDHVAAPNTSAPTTRSSPTR